MTYNKKQKLEDSTEANRIALEREQAIVASLRQQDELSEYAGTLRQYQDLKEKYPDALLLFRRGDFYECYEHDADTAAKVLGITLTWRKNHSADFKTFKGAMAGFPRHALDTYLPKLIRAGLRVAICDQLEVPQQTVKRGITELVSPGVKMQVVDRVNSLTAAEKTLMSQLVSDLETGNHLLGRPRSEEYKQFFAEHGAAVLALKQGATLTDRQRDILLERASQYHGGMSDLAAYLNIDEQQLRKALIFDAVKEQHVERNLHLFEDGLFVFVDSENGFGISEKLVAELADNHYGEMVARAGRMMARFATRDDAAAFISNVGMLNERFTNSLRDTLIEKMRAAGISVSTDWQEGERVLQQENDNLRMMGSRTVRKMREIGLQLSDIELSSEEKKVVDVFSGKKNKETLDISRIDGSNVKFEIKQGSDDKAGTKHAVFRHNNNNDSYFIADDILLVPVVISNGSRSVDGKKISYTLSENNVEYTVVNEVRGEVESFVTLYTNRKALLIESQNTNLIARANNNAISDAKLQNNSEITKENSEIFHERHVFSDIFAISRVLNGEITRQDVERAMDSHLVKSWLKAKNSGDFATMQGFNMFGIGTTLIHKFAKARLGIDNKFEPGKMFYDSWEVVEGYMHLAKENGLDAAIADKYDFHNGSEDVQHIMENPETMYSEEEIAEIGKFLKSTGFEDFKAAVRSFSEAKQIQEEEQHIREYNDGEALTKAFVLYDIVQRRLFAEHEGDERWFRRSEYIIKEDGNTVYGGGNQKPKHGETLAWKWVLKSSIAQELMHVIATSPVTEKVPLLEMMPSGLQRYLDIPSQEQRQAELHNLSDDQLDALYISAMPDNKVVMRDVLDVMAERRGYTLDSSYQGTLAFNGAAPRDGYYASEEERLEAWRNEEFEGNQTLGDYIKHGVDISDLEFRLNDPRGSINASDERLDAIFSLNVAINEGKGTIKMYRAVPADIKEDTFRNGDWITPSRMYAVLHAKINGWEKYRVIEQVVSVDNIWWDGNDIAEWGYDDGLDYRYKNTLNNVKSNDLITYDDQGNVILPSKRFDDRTADVRYMLVPDSQSPIFISNALLALDKIKQDKAAPLQWLRMLEKNGGIKAGEDRWTGLSQWLKDSSERVLTKDAVRAYLQENMIQVEEVHYFDPNDYENSPKFTALQDEFTSIREQIDDLWTEADNRYAQFMTDIKEKYGDEWEYAMSAEELDEERRLLEAREQVDVERDDRSLDDVAFEEMVRRHGDSFDRAFSYDGGDLVLSDESYAFEYLGIEHPINDIRLQYTSKGLSDKREIVLTVPTIASWQRGDLTHFGDAGDGRAIAWVRFGDLLNTTESPVTAHVDGVYEPQTIRNHQLYRLQGQHLWAKDHIATNTLSRDHEGMKKGDEVYVAYVQDRYTHGEVMVSVKPTLEEAVQSMNDYFVSHPRSIKTQEKILVIDEIQSKRHQEGREKGYSDDITEEQLKAAYLVAKQEVVSYRKMLHVKYPGMGDISNLKDFGTPEEYEREHQLTAAERSADIALFRYREGTRNTVPAAPFEKNWHELAMKRMLRYAAENGYGRVAWLNGLQQAERYRIGGKVSSIVINHSKSEPGMYHVIVFDASDNVISAASPSAATEDELRELFGKDITDKLVEGLASLDAQKSAGEVSGDDGFSLQGGDLEVGGEGMKAFYDMMLPIFMNKYGKQWGVHVEDLDLPALEVADKSYGKSLHAVRVTEQMKQDVLDGQPMFFKNGAHQAYGFVHNGMIYIDPRIATAETALHEYTHLWAEVLRQRNPQEWQHIVQMMKATPEIWNYVKHSYPHLTTDDQIADEALAQFSGKRGYKKLQEFVDGQDDKTILDKMMEVLGEFWSAVAEFFNIHYSSKEEVADRVLYDLLHETRLMDYKLRDIEGLLLENNENEYSNENLSNGVISSEERLRLDQEETIKVYRAMQLIDGKLYPPMAGKVNGEWQNPIVLGQWEQSVEHPELVDDKGRFKLDKGNGKSLKARYNPYFHTSTTPLNDQFSSAQSRPELVTVEVEIPKSELTSGYKAAKAKDAVGRVEWKAGPIQSQLSGTREVILSRWDKPVRIVPDTEVAEKIVEMFGGQEIVMPSNVVTPSLRKELEALGVPFVETDNQGHALGVSAHMATVDTKESNDIRYHFVGEHGAMNLDLSDDGNRMEMLHTAERMEQSEQSAKRIKVATGWERGKDGKWRFEIGSFTSFDFRANLEWKSRHPEVVRYLELLEKENGAAFGVSGYEPLTAAEQAEYDVLSNLPSVVRFMEHPNTVMKPSDKLTLEDYMQDEVLYTAYPSLRTLPVTTSALPQGYGGSYGTEEDWYGESVSHYLTINGDTLSKARDMYCHSAQEKVIDTFVHEVQHAIQDIEGFAQGGTPGQTVLLDGPTLEAVDAKIEEIIENPDYRAWQEADQEYRIFCNKVDAVLHHEQRNYAALNQLFDQRDALKRKAYQLYSVEVRELDRQLGVLSRQKDFGMALTFEDYERLAGEVEARNVASRRHLSPVIRQRTLAATTEDLPREQQLVTKDAALYSSVRESADYKDAESTVAAEPAIIADINAARYSSYLNSKALYDAVQSLGSMQQNTVAGYEDTASGSYVFVGAAADLLSRYDKLHIGTTLYDDDVSRPTEYMLSMSEAKGRVFFDEVSASLVSHGYRVAVLDGEHVNELLEPEPLDDDKEEEMRQQEHATVSQEKVSSSSPEERAAVPKSHRVLSAVQLELFASQAVDAARETASIEEPVQNESVLDLTTITLPALGADEHCYVERRYSETGGFSFVGGEHIESTDDVAYIFKCLEDKSVENSFICMVKDGVPTIIHLGMGNQVAVLAPIENALVAFKELQPDKIWFVHNHPSGNLKVSREDAMLQKRMEELYGGAAQPGIIINTTSGKFMAYSERLMSREEGVIPVEGHGDVPVKVYAFDRQVFSADWSPEASFKAGNAVNVAKFVSSHRLGEHEKLSLLVTNHNTNVTGNVFLPWTDIKDACTPDGVALIVRYVQQMSGTCCYLYGSDAAILQKNVKAMSYLQSHLKPYGVSLLDVMSVEREDYYSAREEGYLDSFSRENAVAREDSVSAELTESVSRENTAIRFASKDDKPVKQEGTAKESQPAVSRRLTPADREAGGAMVDHLEKMGITVHTNLKEYRRAMKAAEKDHSEGGHVRFFTADDGRRYGFSYKGEMYLDLRQIDAELPLSQYARLWCQAMQRINPAGWQRIVDTLCFSDDSTWSYVSKLYPHLATDSDVAEEVIAHYSGKRGTEKLHAELQRMSVKDEHYASRWNNIFQNISKAIQDFWKHTGDSLNIQYKNVDDIADMILKDFAAKVNPVKKMEQWLRERDKEYAAAVQAGDMSQATQLFHAALQEHVGSGIVPYVAAGGYRGQMDRLARNVKSEAGITVQKEAINEAADRMAPLIGYYAPDKAVLVPAPSHDGMATDMLALAHAISERTGIEVADVLKSAPRKSQYEVKKETGRAMTSDQLGIYQDGELPAGKLPIVVDNVVNSGNTAKACIDALGSGIVLAIASAVTQDRHVSSLKTAAPVLYDKEQNLVPLSQRFEFKNRHMATVQGMPVNEPVAYQEPDVIQGLEGYDVEDIRAYIQNSVQEVLDIEYPDKDIFIKQVTIIGSRARGEGHEDSDLDILLEYGGDDVREDDLFNMLNDEDNKVSLDGIEFDINPINAQRSMSTADWLARDAAWRAEDESNHQKNNIKNIESMALSEQLEKVLGEVMPEVGQRLDFSHGFMADNTEARSDQNEYYVTTVKHSRDGYLAGEDREGFVKAENLSSPEQDLLMLSVREQQLTDLIGDGNTVHYDPPMFFDNDMGKSERVRVTEIYASHGTLSLRGYFEENGSAVNIVEQPLNLSAVGMENLYQGFVSRQRADQEVVEKAVKEFRYLFGKAALLKTSTDSPSPLYDLLHSMLTTDELLNEHGVSVSWKEDFVLLHNAQKDAQAGHSLYVSAVKDGKVLNDLTQGRYQQFLQMMEQLSSDQVDMVVNKLSSDYHKTDLSRLISLYDSTVKYYNDHVSPAAVQEDLITLLGVTDGKGLVAWATDGSHDHPGPGEMLQTFKDAVSAVSVYDAQKLMTALQDRATAVEQQAERDRLMPDVPMAGEYTVVMDYYLSHRETLPAEQRAAFERLEHVSDGAALSAWTSSVLTGHVLEGLTDVPSFVVENVEELAWKVSETEEPLDVVVQNFDRIGLVNDQRMECLVSTLVSQHHQHHGEYILFKNGTGVTAVGVDADNIAAVTGWQCSPVRYGDKIVNILHINSDGYDVLTDRDMAFRVVNTPVSLRNFMGQPYNAVSFALQTIDSNLLYSKNAPIQFDTAGSLTIGNFKAKTLDFHTSGLDAIAANGEKMVIRDIPSNYYHPEGTLVVADYINGHRETIENVLVNGQPQKQASYDRPDPVMSVYDEYQQQKTLHSDELLLFRQKGFVETFGADAARMSQAFGLPLYSRHHGDGTVLFAMMNTSDYLSLADDITMDVHVAIPQIADSRQAISESLVRMQEQIAKDAAKQGFAAEIYPSGEDQYSVRLVDAVTLEQVGAAVELSANEAAAYQGMVGPAAMSQRSDYVMELVDKYFGETIRQAQQEDVRADDTLSELRDKIKDVVSQLDLTAYNTISIPENFQRRTPTGEMITHIGVSFNGDNRSIIVPAMASGLSQIDNVNVLRDLYQGVTAAALMQEIGKQDVFRVDDNGIRVRFAEPFDMQDAGGEMRQVSSVSLANSDGKLIIFPSQPNGMTIAMGDGDAMRLLLDKIRSEKRFVQVQPDNEYVHVQASDDKVDIYRRVPGWTHDDPALLYNNTEVDVYFYDSEKNTIEDIGSTIGIDAYEDRKGFFVVKSDEYDKGYRQLGEHDFQQRFDDFTAKHGEEPLYAEVTVRFKDDGSEHHEMIKLSSVVDPRDDEKVFFNVDGMDGLMKLLKTDNGEDFDVVDVDGIEFHSKSLYLGEAVNEQQAVKLAAGSYRISYGSDNRPGGVFGDIHVEMTQELPHVTLEDAMQFAADLGGEARLMNGHVWGDFTREDAAMQFADKVVALNADRIIASREEAKSRPMEQHVITEQDNQLTNLEDQSMSEEKKEPAVQEQQEQGVKNQEHAPEVENGVDGQQSASEPASAKKNPFANIDYSKYSMPEGVTVEHARVKKDAEGKYGGGYQLLAVVDGQFKARTMFANDVAAFFNQQQGRDGAKATIDQLVAKYFGTGRQQQGKHEPVPSQGEGAAVSQPAASPSAEQGGGVQASGSESAAAKKKPFTNIDYTKYSMPEGAKVERANVQKITSGEHAGKYGISAIINDKQVYRVMYGNDTSAFFNEKMGRDGAKATLDQLVAKYFGKSTAESMSIGSVGEAEKVLGEQKEAAAQQAAAEKKVEQAAAEQQKKEEQQASQQESKKVVSAAVAHAALLLGALSAAVADESRVWLNKAGKKTPDFLKDNQVISPYNVLMMGLHSDANGYKTNVYTTFKDAQTAGFSVRKGETGLRYNWYSWDHYVNKFDSNDIISKKDYELLPADQKELYKVHQSKEEKAVYNVDQTTMMSVKKDDYQALLSAEEKSGVGRGIKEEIPVSEGASFIDSFKESYPGALVILRTAGDTYELYGDDAVKAGTILGLPVTDSKELKDAGDQPVKVVNFPVSSIDSMLPKLVHANCRIAIADKPESEHVIRRYGTADRINLITDKLISGIEQADGNHIRVSSMLDTRYDGEYDKLWLRSSHAAAPGEEVTTALERAGDTYRAVAAYTGSADRLNRGGKMLPDDMVKYDRLVQELSAGVLMERHGLPAMLSKESLPLVAYWERELKEDPKLMTRLERDVNNTVKVITQLSKGKGVDYSAIRGERSLDGLRPKYYTIASLLATKPDMDFKRVVIVRDPAKKTAAVILPAGASLEVNNEVPGMSKARIANALKKDGIDLDNITFYNAGGSLALNQPNDYFADKEVSVVHLKQYEMITDETFDFSEEIAHTGKVDIKQVMVIKDNEDRNVLYIKPAEGTAVTVYPTVDDLRLFFKSVKTEKFDDVREALGQKYYAFIQQHPEKDAGILMPEVGDVDLSPLSKVSLTKDPNGGNKYTLVASIDGKRQQAVDITGEEYRRLFLVDDKDLYKLKLAAIKYGEQLGIVEGIESARFREHHEGQGGDGVQKGHSEAVKEEEKPAEHRGSGRGR